MNNIHARLCYRDATTFVYLLIFVYVFDTLTAMVFDTMLTLNAFFTFFHSVGMIWRHQLISCHSLLITRIYI